MAAPESTKFQINYKLYDGTLINLYASSVTELESGLADLGMVSSLIKSTGKDLSGTPAQAAPIMESVAAQFGGTPVPAPVTPPGGDSAPQCKHGTMSFRSGVGQKGPWKGWMCAAPKGAVDKCDTVWIR
jgi:hypothetical protein